MKIFISGVAGFLGSHLADAMLAEGHSVVGCDNMIGGDMSNVPGGVIFHEEDCCDRSAMLSLTKGVDVVYHCAAIACEGLSVFSPHTVVHSIVDASVSVFSAAIENNVKRIVFCSSMARYGNGMAPFREIDQTKPCDPYGIAKVAAEDMLRNLCYVHGVEGIIAVPHNIIGPRQKYDDPFRNVASIMINRMLQGKQPVIYGDGRQMRCFSFIQDCIYCLKEMGTRELASGSVINIGPDKEFISINKLAETIADILHFDLDPIYTTGRPQEVKYATCSADIARRLLGYEVRTTMRQGLESMVDYIREKGTREFKYHLPLEIVSDKTPRTWKERLF